MIYSYTQLSHYLACPLRYRYRYVESWQEKETRAGLLFGRAFEQALAAYFCRKDPGQALFEAWSAYRELALQYPNGDSWDRMLQLGITLLERFAQEDRVRISRPQLNLQVKITRPLSSGRSFVAYIDAIGLLDGRRAILEWKTTACRYPDEPQGLLALDPQLVCYSWLTGEAEVALVVFVRKRLPEIQYLKTTISQEQRGRFGQLVAETIARIEAGHFLPRSGIRFPQNGCLSCPYLGLCLGNQSLIEAKLVRRPGGQDLGWLDQLDY